ncbi:MAG: helix-turn-helix transcriptional regulator, partial [Atopobiaceae bacterium]|nr:helix-turn-helix transcriptional regulator [Atopobiaceae bacterium]
MITLTKKTPDVIQAELAERVRARRRELRYSQAELAERSGVSLGSLKRFERTHEISLASLVKLSIALDCREDLETLFARRRYGSKDPRLLAEAVIDVKDNAWKKYEAVLTPDSTCQKASLQILV